MLNSPLSKKVVRPLTKLVELLKAIESTFDQNAAFLAANLTFMVASLNSSIFAVLQGARVRERKRVAFGGSGGHGSRPGAGGRMWGSRRRGAARRPTVWGTLRSARTRCEARRTALWMSWLRWT